MIRHAGRHCGAHGVRHGTVLEVWFAEEAQVVDDDVRPGVDEALDRIHHVEAGRRPAEEELRTRRDIMHDLEERSAFVAGPLLTAAILRDGHVREVLRCLRIGEAVDAVRDDADHDTGAVDAPGGAKLVGTTRHVALRRDAAGADDRAVDAPDRPYPRERGERVERARVDPRLHEAARHVDALDARARLSELRQLVRTERRAIEVHVQTAIGRERRRRGDESAGRRRCGPRRQEPRLDLGVRSACCPHVAKGVQHVIERALRR